MQRNKISTILSKLMVVVPLILLVTACAPAKPNYDYSENKDKGSLVLYAFWGDGCPHCEDAKTTLAKVDSEYPDLNIRGFEIWYNETNAALFEKMADAFNLPKAGRGTPTFFMGSKKWVGYSESIGKDIEASVKICTDTGCPDSGAGIMPGASSQASRPQVSAGALDDVLDLPLIGRVSLANQSVWISTLLISLVDGVNPCSLWVLTMLLALTLHTGSRKKVTIIGIIFLTVTALVYALFIAGLFTILNVVSFIGWIQVVVALMAFFFGVINIKDYFWYKEGLSFTIADDKKPGIFQRMRRLLDADLSFWGLAGATIVMSAGVSLVEFSCTAGFPVLWTNLLVSQKVDTALFIMLLILYMVIYQLDEMVIFFTAVYTLRASKLEEKQGRILKLIGGVLMLTLSFMMIVNPGWMNSLGRSLIIFAVSFGLVGLVLLLHRRVLPALGIFIGSEMEDNKKTGRHRRK
jgi:thiol-disulfide isomerase/thioredoxin